MIFVVTVWIAVAIIAGNKGRSDGGWFLLCLLLTPLAILPLLALRPLTAIPQATAAALARQPSRRARPMFCTLPAPARRSARS